MLSRLAEEQPDLDEASNLRNRSLFRVLSALISELIADASAEALSNEMPKWLVELCTIWHQTGSSVLCFNYDTLVENSVMALLLYDPQVDRRVQPDDIIDRLPPLPNGQGRFGPGPMPETINLYKLHGSIYWFATPNDASGATLARRPVRAGWGRPESLDPGELEREMPGRETFIVPPASAKSAYYRNPALRQIWQNAGRALEAAEEIHLIGYSLQPADLVARGMFTERPRTDVRWTVVNPDPDPVVEQLRDIGVDPDRVEIIHTVEEYTARCLRKLSREAVNQLESAAQRVDPASPVVVSWGTLEVYPVARCRGPQRVLLASSAGANLHHFSTDGVLTAGELLAVLQDSHSQEPVEVELFGERSPVLAITPIEVADPRLPPLGLVIARRMPSDDSQ
ncbi:MAG: hypothetical protein R2714_11130 [Microthrixaceae bacterium]|nr:hypothetical protein [Microthrixaceae bacterium]